MRYAVRSMVPLALVALLGTVAPVAGAQEPASLSGVVWDSIANRPLSQATVQLASNGRVTTVARSATTDAAGRFTFDSVTQGRYLLGYFHDMLDSLGIDPPTREIEVRGSGQQRFDLWTPSAARLRSAVCARSGAAPGSGTVIGFVRDAATGAPVAGADVTARWVELTMSAEGVRRTDPRLVSRTESNGWFALCGVPGTGTMALGARRGTDSTQTIELEVPESGFLRQELYVAGADRQSRVGGRVLTAEGARPLANAIVTIAAAETRTNDAGEWTLSAPLGTRTLEVRAVGYYPDRRPVNIGARPEPIVSRLMTMKAVLDTVRVTASRIYADNLRAFTERRRSMGFGRFLDADEITKRNPLVTSDLLRTIPGLRIERNQFGATQFTMRGLADEQECVPTINFNGSMMQGMNAELLDEMIPVNTLMAIEVYQTGMVPPQFEIGMSGCGTIIIWTRPRSGR